MIIKLKNPIPDIGDEYFKPDVISSLFHHQKQYIVCALMIGIEDDGSRLRSEYFCVFNDLEERGTIVPERHKKHPVLSLGDPRCPSLYSINFFYVYNSLLPSNWMLKLRTFKHDVFDFDVKTLQELNLKTYDDLEDLLSSGLYRSISTYPKEIGLDGLGDYADLNLETSPKVHAYLTPIYHEQRRLNAHIEGL